MQPPIKFSAPPTGRTTEFPLRTSGSIMSKPPSFLASAPQSTIILESSQLDLFPPTFNLQPPVPLPGRMIQNQLSPMLEPMHAPMSTITTIHESTAMDPTHPNIPVATNHLPHHPSPISSAPYFSSSLRSLMSAHSSTLSLPYVPSGNVSMNASAPPSPLSSNRVSKKGPVDTDLFMSAVPHSLITRFRTRPSAPLCAEVIPAHACVLLADISGFTRMAEILSAKGHHGVEELTTHLNKYFDKMIEIITEHGGDVVKFAGDALLLIWIDDTEYESNINSTSLSEEDIWNPFSHENSTEYVIAILTQLTRLASQCSLQLDSELNNYEVGDGIKLFLHSGIGCGKVQLIHVGGCDNRCEFIVVGEPIVQIAKALSLAEKGQVVLSPESYALIGSNAQGSLLVDGFFRMETIRKTQLPLPRCLNLEQDAIALLFPYVNKSAFVRLSSGYSLKMLNEIRTVSVMFALLPGMEFKSRSSVQIVQRFIYMTQKVLNKFDGSIRQFIMDDKGSVLIACFGLPSQSHEDDPYRCVSAALSIQKESKQLNLVSSIGITTGSVFCGVVGNHNRWDFSLVGDLVNLSSRLSSLGQSAITCDEATSKKCSERGMPMNFLRTVQVKGKEQPIPIYSPQSISSKKNSPSVATSEFYGRLFEKTLLHETIESSKKEGDNYMIIYDGECGIGKSSLLMEFEKICQGLSITSIFFNAKEYTSSIMGVWRRYLSILGKKDLRQVDDLIHHLPTMEDGSLDNDIILPFFLMPPTRRDSPKSNAFQKPTDGQHTTPSEIRTLTRAGSSKLSKIGNEAHIGTVRFKKELFKKDIQRGNESKRITATYRIEPEPYSGTYYKALNDCDSFVEGIQTHNLERLLIFILATKAAEKQTPIVVLIDDVDMMEELSGELLITLCKTIKPLVLVVTSQLPVEQHEFLTKITKYISFQSRKLSLLEKEDVSNISKAKLHVSNIAPQLESMLYERSHGNPFLLFHIISTLIQSSDIIIDSNTKTARITQQALEAGNKQTVDSVSAVISRRMDLLDFSKQLLLKVLSCIGDMFPLSVIQGLLNSLEEEEEIWASLSKTVRADIQILISHNFIELIDFEAFIGRSTQTDADGILRKWTTQILRAQKEQVYRFVGGNTRLVIRNLVTKEQRCMISTKIAIIFEIMYQGQLDLYYKDLAEHWHSAGDIKKAMEYYAKGGLFALNSQAISSSIQLFQTAIDLSDMVETPVHMKLRWFRSLGEAYRKKGKTDETIALFHKALSLVNDSTLIDMSMFSERAGTENMFRKMMTVISSFRLLRSLRIYDTSLGIRRDGLLRLEISKILALYSSYQFFSGRYDPHALIQVNLATVKLCAPMGYSEELVHSLLLLSLLCELQDNRLLSWMFRRKAIEIQNTSENPYSDMLVNKLWYIIFMSEARFADALSVFGFDESNQDSMSTFDPRIKDLVLFYTASCYYLVSDFTGALDISCECEVTSRRKENFQLEIWATTLKVMSLIRLGLDSEARTALGTIDYTTNYADIPLSIALKSCAAILFYREGKLSQSIEFLRTVWECAKPHNLQNGVGMAYTPAIGIFMTAILDIWQSQYLYHHQQQHPGPHTTSSQDALKHANGLFSLLDGKTDVHSRECIQPMNQDEFTLIQIMFEDTLLQSSNLSRHYRPARPQHYLFVARHAFLSHISTRERSRVIRSHLSSCLTESREIGMEYEEGLAEYFSAALACDSVSESKNHLSAARLLFKRIKCPREMHEVAILWMKLGNAE